MLKSEKLRYLKIVYVVLCVMNLVFCSVIGGLLWLFAVVFPSNAMMWLLFGGMLIIFIYYGWTSSILNRGYNVCKERYEKGGKL